MLCQLGCLMLLTAEFSARVSFCTTSQAQPPFTTSVGSVSCGDLRMPMYSEYRGFLKYVHCVIRIFSCRLRLVFSFSEWAPLKEAYFLKRQLINSILSNCSKIWISFCLKDTQGYICICVFCIERHAHIEQNYLWITLQIHTQPELGQTRARRLEFSVSLPCGRDVHALDLSSAPTANYIPSEIAGFERDTLTEATWQPCQMPALSSSLFPHLCFS